ncbi:MAG TPA: hypothetical protein VGI10_19905 [Polyangiaceae bacterium]
MLASGSKLGGALTLLALGCSATPSGYTSDAEAGSTHGLITVERSTSVDEPARAAAFAAFVRTPPEIDPATVMRLAGLGLELPALGQCSEVSRERDSSQPLSGLGRIEFLDAGDVLLRTSDTTAALAPRAFPAVLDISGVVYTTRDRSAEPLPAATHYSLGASGGALGAFSVAVDAPAPPSDVRVSGIPLAELSAVSTHSALVLEWLPGSATDAIYADLSTADGSATLRCSLGDTGNGSVPAGAFAGVGAGQLALHRVRSAAFSSPAIDAGQVRFDFQAAKAVSFVE